MLPHMNMLKLSQNVNSKYMYMMKRTTLCSGSLLNCKPNQGSFALQNLSCTLDISLKSENVNILKFSFLVTG